MIYLIFTLDGFEQAKQMLIEDKASLWINQDVLSDSQIVEMTSANIEVFFLPKNADPSNEKSVITAVEYVEQQAPKAEILVEYI